MATIFEVYIANALTELGLTDLIPIGQTPGSPADAGISFNDLLQQLSKGYSSRNLLIDGAFTVNQRGYVSVATLAAGVYGHDRWKAGASGGDYSFTQLPNATQITIASGKSLIQVVEDKNVVGGDYVLSWEGTAQGRYAVDSDTPSGAYADSPIAISSQTAGTTMSVEFDDGTLGKIQLELGAIATEFERLPYDAQLLRCQRYYERIDNAVDKGPYGIGVYTSTTLALIYIHFRTTKRDIPTVGHSGTISHFELQGDATISLDSWSALSGNLNIATIQIIVTGATGGHACALRNNSADATYIDFSSEL